MKLTPKLVLVLAAVVFGVFAALGGFTWWDWAARYEAGWLGASLACGWCSSLV